MLEGAASLLPSLLQVLLQECNSIKAKRLFLWLSSTIDHAWYRYIDISRVSLGVGKRQIVPGEILDSQFLITVLNEVTMDNKNPYFRQVDLLVRILPLLGDYPCFALKGGTAINLFYQNMPRLSGDIDLVYVPIRECNFFLDEITMSLKNLGEAIIERLPNLKVQYSKLNQTENVNRLFVKADRSVVKIELSPVLRGTVYKPRIMRINQTAEKAFGFAEVQVVLLEDLYAGKMMAALERQHPRNLFDIKGLIENEGITYKLKKSFIVYLISHNRRNV